MLPRSVAATESGVGTAYYQYDALNRVVTKTLGNGCTTLFGYDSAGRYTYILNSSPDLSASGGRHAPGLLRVRLRRGESDHEHPPGGRRSGTERPALLDNYADDGYDVPGGLRAGSRRC